MNSEQALSSKQQAIGPIAAATAVGDLPQVNAALKLAQVMAKNPQVVHVNYDWFEPARQVRIQIDQNEARQLPGEAAGDHPRACAAYLTGVHCKQTAGVDATAGISYEGERAHRLQRPDSLSAP